MTDADALRRAMITGLADRGTLTPPWRPALEAVPRHEFIPDTVWQLDRDADGPDMVPLHRTDDPGRWLTHAYTDAPVVTQVDDGHPGPDGRGHETTSSASQPSVVTTMLSALDAEPGMRVLEIGTGTGWNTALMAHRLGAENVVSVEIDPALAEAARTRLHRAGFGAVRVITSGGVAEAAEYGPFDRLIATVGARQVPPAWMAQVRPGGVAIVPWGTEWYPNALLRFDVTTEGGSGRIVGDATFMLLREQRRSRASVGDVLKLHRDAVTSSATEVHPWYVTTEPNAATAIGLQLPDVTTFYRDDGPLGSRQNVVDRATGSWARVRITGSPYPVEQAGPRRLWDEVEAAYLQWQGQGRPARDDWVVMVSSQGQQVILPKAREMLLRLDSNR